MNDTYWVEMMGMEVRYIEGRYRTRAICAGEGHPLLLLHGTGGHAENFSRNISQYARHFRVCAIDMLWHGYSDVSDFDEEILPPLVDHVLDVADTLAFERMHIEGQSMDGWVATLFALLHPERVAHLVLTTPMGYRPDPVALPGLAIQDPIKVRDANLAVLRNPTLEAVRDRLERIVYDPACLTDEAVRVRHKIYNRPEINAVQQKLMASYLGGPKPRKHEIKDEDLRRLTPKTLVCWADHNPLPVSAGQRMAEMIPNGAFHCAKNTGHWAQYENFEEHNRIVIAFLSTAKPERSQDIARP